MGPFWMGTIFRRGTLAFPMVTGSIKSQQTYNLFVPFSMSAGCSDFLSPGANGPVLTNPNMPLNLLERYKSGGNSSDESFEAILSLVFSVASMVLNSTVTGGSAPRPHLIFLFKVLINFFMSA